MWMPRRCPYCRMRLLRYPLSPTTRWGLQVRDRDPYEALQAARHRQQTEPFKAQYARRAGGRHMDGDLRRPRYIVLATTRLLHLLLATALNFIRVAAWLAETPRSRNRPSAFAALAGAFG